MTDPKEEALRMCQKMAYTTMGEGVTLPFHVAKKCAMVAVNRLIQDEEMHENGEVQPVQYWKNVKRELEKLSA